MKNYCKTVRIKLKEKLHFQAFESNEKFYPFFFLSILNAQSLYRDTFFFYKIIDAKRDKRFETIQFLSRQWLNVCDGLVMRGVWLIYAFTKRNTFPIVVSRVCRSTLKTMQGETGIHDYSTLHKLKYIHFGNRFFTINDTV